MPRFAPHRFPAFHLRLAPALMAVALAWGLPAQSAQAGRLLQGAPSMSLASGQGMPPDPPAAVPAPADEGNPIPTKHKKSKRKSKSKDKGKDSQDKAAAPLGLDTTLSLPLNAAANPAASTPPAVVADATAKPARKSRRHKEQADSEDGATAPKGRIAPRVLVITMFEPEARPWLDRLGPWTRTHIPGLGDDYPWLACNRDQVCVVTTGMGHTNAAASGTALALSPKLDLRRSYIVVAGIGGINPEHGTLGTPAWARFLVEWGLQWEIDAREAPADWPTGYLGINTRSPKEKPPLDYRTEVFQIDGGLLRKALQLSHGAQLVDGPEAQASRARYPDAPANQPPRVTQCDTVSGDTWFSGKRLGERASAWTQTLTNGAGEYCTMQQEDNATYEALQRGARQGRVDMSRVLVLRAGSDFDRPPPGVSAAANLLNYTEQGGFDIAVENVYRAALPVVKAISTHWPEWKNGTPLN